MVRPQRQVFKAEHAVSDMTARRLRTDRSDKQRCPTPQPKDLTMEGCQLDRSSDQVACVNPVGQATPVPLIPQYPVGFFARYCWW